MPQSHTADQSKEDARIRNRFNQIPCLTRTTHGKVTKTQGNITFKIAKRSDLSQQVTKGCKEQTKQYDRQTQTHKYKKGTTKEASP